MAAERGHALEHSACGGDDLDTDAVAGEQENAGLHAEHRWPEDGASYPRRGSSATSSVVACERRANAGVRQARTLATRVTLGLRASRAFVWRYGSRARAPSALGAPALGEGLA